jgi:hypothetical protein
MEYRLNEAYLTRFYVVRRDAHAGDLRSNYHLVEISINPLNLCISISNFIVSQRGRQIKGVCLCDWIVRWFISIAYRADVLVQKSIKVMGECFASPMMNC